MPSRERPKPPAGGVKASYPGFIAPALATSITKVPSGERWIHEIKFDGYRVQVHIKDAAVTVFTRRGNDWTKRFKKIADDAWHIDAGSAIIDGEVVAPAADGTTFRSAKRIEGPFDQDRDGRFRPALSQRLRPAETAADRAQGASENTDRQNRHSVQRKLRNRRSGNVQARMQDRA